MAGANYMGGRRNAAKARTKDVTGRMQKGHFIKQRHQILARGLRDQSFDNGEAPRTVQPGKIDDIDLAHARRHLNAVQSDLATRSSIASTVRTPSRTLLHLNSSSPGIIKRTRFRNSKVLEDLDINEPNGLRATLSNILNKSDLAGLRHIVSRTRNTRRDVELDTTLNRSRKKQKTSEQSSSSSSSSFRNNSPTRRKSSSQSLPLNMRQFRSSASFASQLRHDVASRTFSRTSSTVVQETDYVDESFDSSLDQLSALQESESGSSYANSGFSELHFTDEPDLEEDQLTNIKDNTNDIQRGDSRHYRVVKASPQPSDHSYSASIHKFSLKPSEIQHHQNSQASSSSHYIRPSQPTQADHLFYTQFPPVTYEKYIDSWLTSGRARTPNPTPEDTSIEQDTNLEIFRRAGVGFVPSTSNVQHESFVPSATMLPSYSEEDLADHREQDELENAAYPHNIDVDDERLDYDPFSEDQANASTLENHGASRVSFVTPPNSTTFDEAVLGISPRQFTPSINNSPPLQPQSLFSSSQEDVYSHFGSCDDRKEEQQGTPSRLSPTKAISCRTLSRSPDPCRSQDSPVEFLDEQKHFVGGVPQYHSIASSPIAEAFDRPSIGLSGSALPPIVSHIDSSNKCHPNSLGPHGGDENLLQDAFISSVEKTLLHCQDGPLSGIPASSPAADTLHFDSAECPMVASETVDRAHIDTPQPLIDPDNQPSSLTYFDGPDLFAGDADDEDD